MRQPGISPQDENIAPVELRAPDRPAVLPSPSDDPRAPSPVLTPSGRGDEGAQREQRRSDKRRDRKAEPRTKQPAEEERSQRKRQKRSDVTARPSRSAPPAPMPSPTPPPTPKPTPSPDPTPPPAVSVRVTVPEFDIDLPVVSSQLEVPGNLPRYPLCDVAQYLTSFSQPGQGGTVYIYGHAREGMLLRLLQESLQKNGAALLGARVAVETSDGWTHSYEIDLVKRHAVDFSIAEDLSPGQEQVVLQTSEGPRGTVPKLQVGARLVERVPTSADLGPSRAKPRVCA